MAGREIGGASPGLPGNAGGKAKAGTGLPSSREWTSVSTGVASRHTSAGDDQEEQDQRREADRAAHA